NLFNQLKFKHRSPYKNFNFALGRTTPEHIDSLESFEVKDSDAFLVTYPKSGTIWTQQIIISIYEQDGHPNECSTNIERMPWLEYETAEYTLLSSPRLFSSHLPEYLMPPAVKEKKSKVVYVMRNPKDNIVSYYHFTKGHKNTETPKSFEQFFEWYMTGRVTASSWFDHIRGWYSGRDQYNILILTYEDMIMDLKGVVKKLCSFLGKNLTEAAIDQVVEKSKFDTMKNNPKANYQHFPPEWFNGKFLRKGQIGDWKNTLTVAQSERVDRVFQEKLGDLSLKFIWE
uniref:Sulfotransferase n=1 Tax=Amphilophus citrinellus TaxID=61819 RepID=A0A3Q0SJ69_AMPCI